MNVDPAVLRFLLWLGALWLVGALLTMPVVRSWGEHHEKKVSGFIQAACGVAWPLVLVVALIVIYYSNKK